MPLWERRRGQLGPLAVGADGGRLSYETVYHTFKTRVIAPLAAQFPSTSQSGEHGVLHGFRHHFVSECLRQGMDPGAVQEWIGHKDSKIIERYRHLAERDGWNKMKQLDSEWSEMLPDDLAGPVCPLNGANITSRRNVNDSSTTPMTTA